MVTKKKIEPSVVNYRKYAYGIVTAKIKAPNSETALAYFKGRFGMAGELVKIDSKITFTIKGKTK